MTTIKQAALRVFPDADALAQHAAHWLLNAATGSTGRFAIALSGGGTPRRLYQTLATAPFADSFPWHRVHLFWGDERFVPHDDPQSNYRMVHEALLRSISLPATHIHAIPTGGFTVEDAARFYEHELKAFLGSVTLIPEQPLFDAVLLGLGADGHTASLFPGSTTLRETRQWVAAVPDAKPPRITLTFPALESTRQAAFLVQGEAKREILSRLMAADEALPAAHYTPIGKLWIFADRAARPTGDTG